MKANRSYTVRTVIFCGLMLVLSLGLRADHRAPTLETIDQGKYSGFRYGDSSFSGADLVIRNQRVLEWFWRQHVMTDPPPPVPEVDFEREVVIVSILGWQPSGRPTITILDADLDHECDCLRVRVEEDTRQGGPRVITNPYHVLKMRGLRPDSVLFERQETQAAGSAESKTPPSFNEKEW